jgi:hypothetical protein
MTRWPFNALYPRTPPYHPSRPIHRGHSAIDTLTFAKKP